MPESVVTAEVIPEPNAKPAVPVPEPPPSPPPAPVPTWIVQARQVDLLTVASHVGVEVVEGTEPGEQMIRPCPRCGSAEGVTVFVNPRWNARQWRCPACKGRGGNLDLASYALLGAPLGKLDDEGREAVKGWFEEMGWCGG
jgi:hypothetical protein